MSAPTKRQREVLVVIVLLCAAGTKPTVREIATAIGVSSPNTVQQHLLLLGKKGLVERADARHRHVRLTTAGIEAARTGEAA